MNNKIKFNLDYSNDLEKDNFIKVKNSIIKFVENPNIEDCAVMPDACPVNGSAPVGTVIVTKDYIYPEIHSADVCCSMFASNIGKNIDEKKLLDISGEVTHFGPSSRNNENVDIPDNLKDKLNSDNTFLNNDKVKSLTKNHLMTQGDGNHFLFLGKSENTSDYWLITHHGSRGVGAGIYKIGMKIAKDFIKKNFNKKDNVNPFLDYNTKEGEEYWEALCFIKEWTYINHKYIHDNIMNKYGGDIIEQNWNEHNFVHKIENKFTHFKGATPLNSKLLTNNNGIQIIPVNMNAPILFVKGDVTENNLGFAPHGAGRLQSRTAFKKGIQKPLEEFLAEETDGIDVRFYSGNPDHSELPSAYKSYQYLIDKIEKYNICKVVDKIQPCGCIMAGHIDWKALKKQKKEKYIEHEKKDIKFNYKNFR